MKKFILSIVALISIGLFSTYANYTVTQGSGTTFGSVVVGGINYAQQFICDLTTPAQCASVSAGGAVKVDASATTQPVSAASLPLPTGAATSANQSTEITALNSIVTNTGAAIPSGSAIIGKVGIDQTTPGTTNGISIVGVNGATALAGTGAVGTGAQRVAIGTDTATIAGSSPGTAGSASANVVTVQGVASMTKLLVTPDSIALPANQSVNTAQVNGVTTLTGTGATGTGAQRVTVSTDQATNAGAALVKGGVGTVNGGSTYQAVAASQTATVLQSSTGAIGDYLSHCDIYPTSTSPGVVTVFDNTNAAAGSAILFAGGSSSITNLVPFAIPVGAVSTAGAWKVTTGANVSVVCFGKFS